MRFDGEAYAKVFPRPEVKVTEELPEEDKMVKTEEEITKEKEEQEKIKTTVVETTQDEDITTEVEGKEE